MAPHARSSPSFATQAFLLLAAGTLGGALATLLARLEAPAVATPPAPPAPANDGLEPIERRLDALEQRLAAAGPETVARALAEPTRSDADADLQRRIEALEQRLAGGDTPVLAPSPGAGSGPGGAPAGEDPAAAAARQQREQARQREDGQRTILDPNSTAAQKLAAWSMLRGIPDSYDDAVVAAMTEIGLSSPDAAVRANVWRQADGRSTHPAMGPALVQALQTDGEAEVRAEAAETLENYVDLPGVRQALEAAAQGDAEESVRRHAANSLRPQRR